MDTNFNLLISTSNKWWHDDKNIFSFCEKIHNAIKNQSNVQIYSTVNRVDEMDLLNVITETLSLSNAIPVKADWTNHGKEALYLRNNELVKIIDAAIIFWDGKTKSELDLFKLCQTKNKPCKTYKFSIDLNRR